MSTVHLCLLLSESKFDCIWTLYNRQRREHRVFEALLMMIPGLEERLMNGSEEDTVGIAEMVRSVK